jgi:hypothetical protein
MHATVIAFAACTLACTLAHIAIVASVVRSRSAVVGPGVPRPKLLVEIVWAVLPALVLALVLTATWDRVRDNAAPQPNVMMKVAR